jgi:hypothetical protein
LIAAVEALGVGRRRLRARETAAFGCVAGGIAIALAVRAAPPSTSWGVAVTTTAAVLVAGGLVYLGRSRYGLLSAILSPLGMAAAVLLAQFGARPAIIVVDPGSATWGLAILGFSWSNVSQAAALGVAGVGLFGIGLMVAWRQRGPGPLVRGQALPRPRYAFGVAATLGAGCMLWGTLFARLGGPAALADDPTGVHLGKFGAAYGVFGLLLCFAAALYALWAWLRNPGRFALALFGAAAAIALLGSFCLATRSVVFIGVLAALALVLRGPRPSRKVLPVTGLVALSLAVLALGLGAVRGYTQFDSLSGALESVTESRPLRTVSAEMIQFDHLVAVYELVPEVLPWLHGESIRELPLAFVPRAFWPEKPDYVDKKLSAVLYGPGTEAGNPFTLPGELYWDFGFEGSLIGMALMGLLAGRGWQWLVRRKGPARDLLTAVVFGHTYLLLTYPLAPMLVLGLLAAAAMVVVCWACDPPWPARAAVAFARARL